ncbi:MAG TPA: cryptochrome/photolyase family protein [Candidatus Izemoplasmatales bacterium]|nr:cryptochrome/photolyase family protein [Candidatus Izemoplasmatales bacterium]
MKHLILLSHQLNRHYIDFVRPTKISLCIADAQFNHFNYHQFRIIYHLSAAKHFAKNHKIDVIQKSEWIACFKHFNKHDDHILFHPNDQWLIEDLKDSFAQQSIKVKIIPDINFFYPQIETKIDRPYHLNRFYRRWRKENDILMEGQLDKQSALGKAPFRIARMAS